MIETERNMLKRAFYISILFIWWLSLLIPGLIGHLIRMVLYVAVLISAVKSVRLTKRLAHKKGLTYSIFSLKSVALNNLHNDEREWQNMLQAMQYQQTNHEILHYVSHNHCYYDFNIY